MSHRTDSSFWLSARGALVLAALAITAIYLLTERSAQVLAALPFLLFLSCPLMHLFMHHGHGGHVDPTPATPPRQIEDGRMPHGDGQ